MKRSGVIFIIFCLAFLQFSQPSLAQLANTGFTPYSLFGVGDLTRQGTTYSQHMAGIGTGDRNIRYLNTVNPAAVTAIQQKSFMMDFGIRQNNVIYQTNSAKSADNTFNLDHIVLAFPIAKKGAFHFGVNTYSAVGYNFVNFEMDDKLLAEMGDIRYYQYGEGGLYRGFLGAGVCLFQRLNLGVDGQVYFGDISHYHTAYFSTNSNYRSINVGNINANKGVSAKFGLQYEQPLGKSRSIVVGATYQLPVKLGGTTVNYALGTSSSTDTIKYEVLDMEKRTIPAEISAGISYRSQDKFMVGFDYTRQDWSSSTEFTKVISATKKFEPCLSQSFRAGMEWTPNRYDIRYYFKRITYHAGIYYDQQYYSLNGYQISSQGITFGISLPVSRYFNSVNLGVELGQRGTLKNNLIRERYCMFTIGFAFHDIWFIKQMYD